MCGIAGLFSSNTLSEQSLINARSCLSTRGPDGEGTTFFSFSENNHWHHSAQGTAALLQTRLSIRDLSSAGAQPMKNEDGSVWIVYNGEIYGWEEEAQVLRSRGHHFASHCDTEFILHGYEEWGDAVLDHLRGMFAFAIVDLRKQRLFLGRDRLGEKPLFYTATNGTFAFASTARALLALTSPHTKPQFNPNAIDAFLTHRYIPAPLSIIDGFYKLPAAHSMVVHLDQEKPIIEQPQSYWAPTPSPKKDPPLLFREAVDLRLASDRPLGVFLSGGIDSQALVASLSGNNKVPSKLSTFTATFPNNPRYDESVAAAKIAKQWECNHTELPITMGPSDALSIIHDLDEPFADPSAIPTWYLCQAAVKKITVALAGDGGDELFAGYKRYGVHERAARLLPRHGKTPSRWNSSNLCLKTSRELR